MGLISYDSGLIMFFLYENQRNQDADPFYLIMFMECDEQVNLSQICNIYSIIQIITFILLENHIKQNLTF